LIFFHSVRTDAQGQFIVNRFPEYKGKVTYVLVPVIEKVLPSMGLKRKQLIKDLQDGAYDEAVKDVDAIIHAASPVPINLDFDDPQGSASLTSSTGDGSTRFGDRISGIPKIFYALQSVDV
jgi:hypothetical protein